VKAKLLTDAEMVNPAYEVAIDKTGIEPRITVPAGETIDNPDAWMLCSIGTAAPEDDECSARLIQEMGDPARKRLLEQVRRLRAASGVQQLDGKSKKWLEYMEKAYAKELGIESATAE
jgi:hypothetical protein